MIIDFLQQFTGWFVGHEYLGIFLAALGLFPVEIVIALVAAINPEDMWLISLTACIGGTVGGALTYLIGYLFDEDQLFKWAAHKGRFLKIKQSSVNASRARILNKGFIYIFLTRLIPWVRIAATLAAGFLHMKFIPFLIASFLGTFVYALPIAYIGTKVGANFEEIKKYILIYNKWIIGITIVYILLSNIYKNRKQISKIFIINRR